MSILQLKFLQRIGTLTPTNVVLAAADAWQTVVNKIQGQINYRAQVFRTGGAQENPKIWIGTVTTSGGNWTVNYSSAGFTEYPVVVATARASGQANGDANYASVRDSTITNTSCSGRASNAVTVGILLATVNQPSPDGTLIQVVAIGK